jgi:hypothetical protein
VWPQATSISPLTRAQQDSPSVSDFLTFCQRIPVIYSLSTAVS